MVVGAGTIRTLHLPARLTRMRGGGCSRGSGSIGGNGGHTVVAAIRRGRGSCGKLGSRGSSAGKGRGGLAAHRDRRSSWNTIPVDLELYPYCQRDVAPAHRSDLPHSRVRAAAHLHAPGVERWMKTMSFEKFERRARRSRPDTITTCVRWLPNFNLGMRPETASSWPSSRAAFRRPLYRLISGPSLRKLQRSLLRHRANSSSTKYSCEPSLSSP